MVDDQNDMQRRYEGMYEDDENVSHPDDEPEYAEGDDAPAVFYWEDSPDVQFSDIGGYGKVKQELIKKVINPVQNDTSHLYERFDVEPAKGIIFHGPPGTGKTMFARALANNLDRDYIELSQADLTHNWINKSSQMIKELFIQANERHAVVFIDEAEMLFADRSNDHGHNEDKKVTNTFLRYLTLEDTNFFVILATNMRDSMDNAATRSGRIDLEFEIGLPNKKARLKIVRLELQGVPNDLTTSEMQSIADHTEDLSGADIVAIVTNAKFVAIDRQAEKMKFSDFQQGYKDFKSAKG